METINNLADFLTAMAEKKNYPKGLQLALYNNHLGAEDAKALAIVLQSGQCPQELKINLGVNQLGAEGAKALAVALQSGQCPQGLQLHLYNNQLGAEGVKALAMALQSGQCPRGLQLNFSGNELGAEAIEALTMALQRGQCPQGLQLDLRYNQQGAEQGKAFAMALQSGQCPQGLQLILSHNRIGDEVAKAFAVALHSGQCPQGLRLYLAYNEISAEGAKALAIALQSGQCPQGLHLSLGNNQLSDEDDEILKAAWAVYYAHQQDNFINCMTLYQGHDQVDSPISLLPQEILQEICHHILPATPILVKMTEISAKVFRAQWATLKLADISMHTKQFDNALKTALSPKKFTEKAAKIKTAINDFLQQEVESMGTKKFVKSSTVALLCKFHLLAGNKVSSLAAPDDHPDGCEDRVSIQNFI